MLSSKKDIKDNLGRALRALRRHDFRKAMSEAIFGLEHKREQKLMGPARIEINTMIEDFCKEFSTHPFIVKFLARQGIHAHIFLKYNPEQTKVDQVFIDRFKALIKALEDDQAKRVKDKEYRLVKEKNAWLQQGKECFADNEHPRGRSFFHRVADKFGDEPGVLQELGEIMYEHEHLKEAAAYLKKSISKFPSQDKAYRLLAQTYTDLEEFEEAEELYKTALKTFGAHPMTLVNFGKMYLAWRKKNKAYDYARQALKADPDLEEAKELLKLAD